MRRLPRLARLGAILNVVGLLCLAVAFARRHDVRDGAFFGATESAGSAASSPWMVACAVLVVAGTTALVASSRRG